LSSVWFHFVGRIIFKGSLGDLNAGQYRREDSIRLDNSTYLAINAEPRFVIDQFKNEPLIQLEIIMNVSWKL